MSLSQSKESEKACCAINTALNPSTDTRSKYDTFASIVKQSEPDNYFAL